MRDDNSYVFLACLEGFSKNTVAGSHSTHQRHEKKLERIILRGYDQHPAVGFFVKIATGIGFKSRLVEIRSQSLNKVCFVFEQQVF